MGDAPLNRQGIGDQELTNEAVMSLYYGGGIHRASYANTSECEDKKV
jgi:hypothetical protein